MCSSLLAFSADSALGALAAGRARNVNCGICTYHGAIQIFMLSVNAKQANDADTVNGRYNSWASLGTSPYLMWLLCVSVVDPLRFLIHVPGLGNAWGSGRQC